MAKNVNLEITNSIAFQDCLKIFGELKVNFTPAEPYVLLDGIMNTTHNSFANILFGLVMHELYGYNLAYVTPLNSDHFVCQLYEAIGAERYILYDRGSERIKEKVENMKSSLGVLGTNKNLLGLKFDSIEVGDLIYDHIIRVNPNVYTLSHASANQVTKEIDKALNAYYTIEHILKQINIDYSFLSHKYYATFGILGRSLLNKGAVIVSKLGNHLKKLGTDEDFNASDFKISKTILHRLLAEANSEEVYDLLKSRFEGDINDLDVFYAYKTKDSYSVEKIYADLELSSDQPIACIMAHAFSDVPHCDTSMIYDDYYLWLVRTFELTNHISTVQWLVKPHPTAELYGEKGVVEELVEKFEHLKLVPSDIKTNDVLEVADTVISVRGTVGMEAVYYNIRPILAGHSEYGGVGISIDCHSEQEYIAALKNIRKKSKLEQKIKDIASYILYNRSKSWYYTHPILGLPRGHSMSNDAILAHEINNLKMFSHSIDKHNYKNQIYYKAVKSFMQSESSTLSFLDIEAQTINTKLCRK